MPKRSAHPLLIGLAALLPLLIAVGALYAAQGVTPLGLFPVAADEVLYWHQAATFRAAGFNGGYYTDYEATAPADFTAFYAWGPFVPAFYGLVSRLTGWPGYSGIVIVNLAFFTVVWAGLLWATRPPRKALALMALVLLGFVPFWLYAPRSLTELQNQAIGVGMALGLGLILTDGATPRRVGALAAWILFASLMRLTWALMFLPLGLALARRWWHVPLAAAGTVVMLLPLTWLTGYVAAPYPDFLTRLFDMMAASPSEGVAFLLEHLHRNWWAGVMGAVIERYVFLHYLLITAVAAGALVWGRWHNQPARVREAWVHLGTLAGVFVTVYLAYDTFDLRGLRVLAPHLLTSLLLLALAERHSLVLVSLGLTLMTAPAALTTYQMWSAERVLTPAYQEQLAGHATAFADELAYTPHAPSAWCNTLVINVLYHTIVPSPVLAIPPGIGTTHMASDRDLDSIHETEEYALRSRYIAWDGVGGPLPDVPNTLVPAQSDLFDGRFYLNADTAC